LCNLTRYWAAEAIFTDIRPDGTCTLSRPLPKDLPAGPVRVAVLKYLPFYPPRLNGAEPGQFRETMVGWLRYARTISDNTKRVLGTEGQSDPGFDVEVWNE